MIPLEDLIRSNVILGKKSHTGFEVLKCSICNDYKIRAGFKFENDHIGYHCFNCNFNALYEESCGYLSRDFRKLLLSLNLDENDVDKCLSTSFIKNAQDKKYDNKEITLESLKKLNISTPEIALPEGSVRLNSLADDSTTRISARGYLEGRGLSEDIYPWYVVKEDEGAERKNENNSRRTLVNRIIIPFFRAGKVIYWQARAIDANVNPRYLNSQNPKSSIVFGYDELYSYTKKPLFITEGIFDAISISGISLLGSNLSDEIMHLLEKCNRRIIFVIDRDKTGKKLALQAIEKGWEITFPPNGTNDVNDSIVKRGRLFTIYHLMTNIVSGFIAKTQILLQCKR